ncbi:MAG TPA: MraY family glycosyltransferase [Stenomitos sp.]
MSVVLSGLALILSLAIAWQAIPKVLSLGLQHQWVDRPDARKVHQGPVVRVGGMAIALGTALASLCVLGVGTALHTWDGSLGAWGVLLGALGFFAVGFADDLLQLPPLPRLVLQLLFATVAWGLGVRVEYLPIPGMGAIATGFLSLPITLVWLAGTANAINWLDGLDGLAGGVGALSALLLAIVAWQQGDVAATCLALTLMGATLAFLRFNLPPAKLFMGDGGSYFIGFMLAAISAISTMQIPTFTSALLPFIVLGVPLCDMTLVMLNRVRKGKSPLYPDRSHLHHRLLDSGCTPLFATGCIWACSGWVGSWAIALAGTPWGWFVVGGATLPGIVMGYLLIRTANASAAMRPIPLGLSSGRRP